MISKAANWGTVCISDMKYHITSNGAIDRTRTDVYLYVVDGGRKRVLTPDEVRALLGEELLRTLGIESITVRMMQGIVLIYEKVQPRPVFQEAYSVWDGFDIDPVLWAIIAIFLLLLLALLLLCCLWWCCARWSVFYPIF